MFLASCWFFTQHMGLNSVMLLLGISKAPFLTLLCFYTPSPAPQCPWVPWLSPLTAPHLHLGPVDPSCHRERQKVLQVPRCRRARLEGAGNGVPGKLLCDGDGEGQELGNSRKNKMCTCGRAGGALHPSLCVPHGPEMELRWVFPPVNAARAKGA